MKQRSLFFGLVSSIAVTACAPIPLYEGPPLDQDKVAYFRAQTLTHPSLVFFGQSYIALVRKIDEKEVTRWGSLRTYEFLPGQHSLSIEVRKEVFCLSLFPCYASVGSRSLSFAAEAGHGYCMPGLVADDRVWAWVDDVTAGEQVAGHRPPGYEFSGGCSQENNGNIYGIYFYERRSETK